MATIPEKLAESLALLRNIQIRGVLAINSKSLTRIHRERLLRNGFIKEVYKGWYTISSPSENQGSSTSWYSSYWQFCAQFLENKYKTEWIISAEQSLLFHAGNYAVPTQLIIKSPKANNAKADFPHGTSLFHLKGNLPEKAERIIKDEVRMYSLPAAIINATPNTFTNYATDARTALSMIQDSSDILKLLLEGGNSKIAGRLIGAFRNIDAERIADDIFKTMTKAGYDVREIDPFDKKINISVWHREKSPYGKRIKIMWSEMRQHIIDVFPKAPGIPSNKEEYLEQVEKIYTTDAYHSLSIEKYQVTPELIEGVRNGSWDVHNNEKDRNQRDAMAAKGYLDAFQAVKKSISKIFEGRNSGEVADYDHGDWYRALFGPSIFAGILKPADLVGYRNAPVYISNSMHVPLNVEAVRNGMPVLFELLKSETEGSARAVLGHFIFVFIHPYIDGNGRMGRFLLNLILASAGYPWTVIPVQLRDKYMEALEEASVRQNIKPFAEFISFLVSEAMAGRQVAQI